MKRWRPRKLPDHPSETRIRRVLKHAAMWVTAICAAVGGTALLLQNSRALVACWKSGIACIVGEEQKEEPRVLALEAIDGKQPDANGYFTGGGTYEVLLAYDGPEEVTFTGLTTFTWWADSGSESGSFESVSIPKTPTFRTFFPSRTATARFSLMGSCPLVLGRKEKRLRLVFDVRRLEDGDLSSFGIRVNYLRADDTEGVIVLASADPKSAPTWNATLSPAEVVDLADISSYRSSVAEWGHEGMVRGDYNPLLVFESRRGPNGFPVGMPTSAVEAIPLKRLATELPLDHLHQVAYYAADPAALEIAGRRLLGWRERYQQPCKEASQDQSGAQATMQLRASCLSTLLGVKTLLENPQVPNGLKSELSDSYSLQLAALIAESRGVPQEIKATFFSRALSELLASSLTMRMVRCEDWKYVADGQLDARKSYRASCDSWSYTCIDSDGPVMGFVKPTCPREFKSVGELLAIVTTMLENSDFDAVNSPVLASRDERARLLFAIHSNNDESLAKLAQRSASCEVLRSIVDNQRFDTIASRKEWFGRCPDVLNRFTERLELQAAAEARVATLREQERRDNSPSAERPVQLARDVASQVYRFPITGIRVSNPFFRDEQTDDQEVHETDSPPGNYHEYLALLNQWENYGRSLLPAPGTGQSVTISLRVPQDACTR